MDEMTRFHKYILLPHQLEIHFMPIVRFNRVRRLVHWDTMGHEALLRGPEGTLLRRPDVLFALAGALGCKRALELWCIDRALTLQPELPRHTRLFINVGVETLLSAELLELLADQARRIDASQVVFEILEGTIPSIAALRDRIARFSSLGYQFAIDDIGGRGSGLSRMVQIGPVDYLKIDRTFLPQVWARDAERARGWLEGIRETARVTGAQIVIEGIEEQFLGVLPDLHRLGISLGQGYLFGAAAALPTHTTVTRPATVTKPARLAPV